jgi:hypothetical protein
MVVLMEVLKGWVGIFGGDDVWATGVLGEDLR